MPIAARQIAAAIQQRMKRCQNLSSDERAAPGRKLKDAAQGSERGYLEWNSKVNDQAMGDVVQMWTNQFSLVHRELPAVGSASHSVAILFSGGLPGAEESIDPSNISDYFYQIDRGIKSSPCSDGCRPDGLAGLC
jgi:hypothetical protein